MWAFNSVPTFIAMFIIIYLFGYQLKWFPSLYPSNRSGAYLQFLGYFIPIIALSLWPIAHIARMIRGELSEILDEDFMYLAKIKGLNRRQMIFRHGFRNMMVPILPILTTTFIYVLTNSFFVERIYRVPGLADWFLYSLITPMMDSNVISIDTKVIVAICVFYSFISLTFSLIVDIVNAYVIPE